MTFSYSDTLATPGDVVRFLIGDTDEEEHFLENEEITFLIRTWVSKNSPYFAAAMAAKAIAAKLTRETNYSDGADSISLDGLQQKYLTLASDLMLQYEDLMSGGELVLGGIEFGQTQDGSIIPPSFGKGMSDEPDTSPDDGTWRENQVSTAGYTWPLGDPW